MKALGIRRLDEPPRLAVCEAKSSGKASAGGNHLTISGAANQGHSGEHWDTSLLIELMPQGFTTKDRGLG